MLVRCVGMSFQVKQTYNFILRAIHIKAHTAAPSVRKHLGISMFSKPIHVYIQVCLLDLLAYVIYLYLNDWWLISNILKVKSHLSAVSVVELLLTNQLWMSTWICIQMTVLTPVICVNDVSSKGRASVLIVASTFQIAIIDIFRKLISSTFIFLSQDFTRRSFPMRVLRTPFYKPQSISSASYSPWKWEQTQRATGEIVSVRCLRARLQQQVYSHPMHLQEKKSF